MDDGLRLWVDDDRVVDGLVGWLVRDVSGTLKLSKGDHTVRVEYYNRGLRSRDQHQLGEASAATATPVTQPTNTPVAPPESSPAATSRRGP